MNTDTRDLSEGFPREPRKEKNTERVYDEVAHALRRKAMRDYDEDMQYKDRRVRERREGGMGNGATFNGSTKFVNAMLLVIAGLATAAICGEVVVYGQVQAIAKTVDLLVAGKIRIGP